MTGNAIPRRGANGCGTCIAKMQELEELYQQFQQENINLIGVGTDSGEGEEQHQLAGSILKEKGVTDQNISPSPDGEFYQEFVSQISSYPSTYVVDSEGNILGAPVAGNVKKQLDTIFAYRGKNAYSRSLPNGQKTGCKPGF